MFSIHYGGENLSVLFKSEDILRMTKSGFEPVQQISCAIVGDSNIPKGVGSAVRSELDTPDDIFGMEIALGRALRRLTKDKDLRKEFWSAFYQSVNGELEYQEFVGELTNSSYDTFADGYAAELMEVVNNG